MCILECIAKGLTKYQIFCSYESGITVCQTLAKNLQIFQNCTENNAWETCCSATLPHCSWFSEEIPWRTECVDEWALSWVLHLSTDSFLHGISHFETMCTNKKGVDLKNLQIFGQCLTCCYSTSIRAKHLILCRTLCYTLKNTHVKNWSPISFTTRVIKKMR